MPPRCPSAELQGFQILHEVTQILIGQTHLLRGWHPGVILDELDVEAALPEEDFLRDSAEEFDVQRTGVEAVVRGKTFRDDLLVFGGQAHGLVETMGEMFRGVDDVLEDLFGRAGGAPTREIGTKWNPLCAKTMTEETDRSPGLSACGIALEFGDGVDIGDGRLDPKGRGKLITGRVARNRYMRASADRLLVGTNTPHLMISSRNFFMRCTAAFVGIGLAASFTRVQGDDLSLFNGRDLSGWQEPLGTWTVTGAVTLNPINPKIFFMASGEGIVLNNGKSAPLISKAEHGDADIHLEFCVPKGSNSGVYVQGRYEVQIFDSFGAAAIAEHDCGAIYERWKDNQGYEGHAPKVNASKAPGEWQSFDISFRAPRFDATGRKIENARFLKVVLNGQVIHENIEVTGPTRGGRSPEVPNGPLLLQGDHGPVAFRNLRIVPRPEP